VALKLGAASAVAMDIDPDAIEVTRENAARNRMTLETTTKPLDASRTAPIVLANIEARVLVPMARELAAHVDPGGLLLLSGILVPQKDEVRAAYADMELLAAPSMGEWTLLALRK
jgi:ribosomal protein L11 methyltransferase